MQYGFTDSYALFAHLLMAWKSIYQELKKGWNETVWSIIVKSHWGFVTGQVLK